MSGWQKRRRASPHAPPSTNPSVNRKALVENDAYDVAKSLVISRSNDISYIPGGPNRSGIESSQIRLIRRSGQVVPWNYSKIEVAVRKAFLSLRLDSEPAVNVARKVTQNALATGQAFINIEDVQDIVQEELMKQGFFKVINLYSLPRPSPDRTRAVDPPRK